MANVTKTLTIDSAGADTGTFTITTNTGAVLATGVTRAQLLAGVLITYDEDTTTKIIVTDNGVCGGSVSLDIEPPEYDCTVEGIQLNINSGDTTVVTNPGTY